MDIVDVLYSISIICVNLWIPVEIDRLRFQMKVWFQMRVGFQMEIVVSNGTVILSRRLVSNRTLVSNGYNTVCWANFK